jgi:ubiquitin-protein ligase
MNFCHIRLQRDLKFLQKNFVHGGALEPLENDPLVWHGNVRLSGPDGQDEAVYHIAVGFSSSYPTIAPVVRFMTPVPHPNVQADGKKETKVLLCFGLF